MENNPQVLLCIPDPTIRKNIAGQIIPPGISAKILETQDLATTLSLIREDTNHRIKIVIIGLFEEIEGTLVEIMMIRQNLNAGIKTILVYDPIQLNEEGKTHKDLLDQIPSESATSVDLIFPYPINILEMRGKIAGLLTEATTAQP